ncbi:MAG: GAF domain-containing sensor histidine kinase [Caldilineaceae bacterium]
MSRTSFSDTYRDAEKYRQLVRALRHATRAIRDMEEEEQPDLEAVLTKLLPDITVALNGQRAFVAKASGAAPGSAWFDLVTVYPNSAIPEQRRVASELLRALQQDGRPRVIDTLDEEASRPISGLAFFKATSAILVRMQIVEQSYLVGVCNKLDPTVGPFLAGDRMTLENLLELVAVGARTNKRRQLELESIEHISRMAAQGTPQQVASEIVQQAVQVTRTLYAELWQVNRHQLQLDFVTAFHAQAPNWQPSHHTLTLDRQSMAGFVALTAKSRYAPVTAVDPYYQAWHSGVLSAFCAPLRYNDRTLGVLFVASAVRDGISSDDRRFIEQLAPHAAIALHHARLQAVNQQVIGFLQAITDVLPLDEQLTQLMVHLPRYVNTANLFLSFYDTARNEITFPLAFEKGEPVADARKAPGELYGPQTPGQSPMSFTEWVLRHRTTLLVENFAIWPERYSIDPAARIDVKSCLVTPLLRQERIVGALGLRSFYADRGSFDEYDRQFIEGIANHVAIILDNAARYGLALADLQHSNEELRLRVQELKAVSEFQRQISDIDEEAQEIENIYHEALAAMQGVGLQTGNMYIALYNEAANTLHFPLAYEQGRRVTAEEMVQSALYRPTRLGQHQSVAEWILLAWKKERRRDALLINDDFQGWIAQRGIQPFPTNTQSWLGAPMIFRDQLIGMIGLRDPQQEGAFKESHRELLEIIASQAAIAIANARLFGESQERIKELTALNQAASAIARAGLERDAVLQTILEQAVHATGAFFGTIQLAENGNLAFISAWPEHERDRLRQRYGVMPLTGPGVTVRAFKANDAQLVPDVHADPDFVDSNGISRSALAVVLRRGGNGQQPIGVFNVEHSEPNHFTAAHRTTLIALSNLAVAAIENAQTAEQLIRSNAIAVMAAWGADIVHDIHREVAVVRLALETLRVEEDLPHYLLIHRLQEIDTAVSGLVMPMLPEQLPEPGATPKPQDYCWPDLVIHAEVENLRHTHRRARFHLDLTCPGVEIQMHELWLRRLLRHLVKNATAANSHALAPLEIVIGTRQRAHSVEISVQDNGRGVRPEIEKMLFNRPIPHRGEREHERMGRGLLLVRHIVELHGGQAWLHSNRPGEAVCFCFSAPRLRGEKQNEKP